MLNVNPALRANRNDLSEIARKGISGAKYVFDTLEYWNKYAIRPAFAGRAIGVPTSEAEVLRAWGMLPSKRALGGWGRPLAEFGTGAVLDWTNLISFGGKSAAGQLLKRAGQYDSAISTAGRRFATDFADDAAKKVALGATDAEKASILGKVISEQPRLTQRALTNFGEAGLIKNAPQAGRRSLLNPFPTAAVPDNLTSNQIDEFLSSVKKLDDVDLRARNIAGPRTLARQTKLKDVIDVANPSDELLQAGSLKRFPGKPDFDYAKQRIKGLADKTLTNDIGIRIPFSENDLIGFKIPGLGGGYAKGMDELGDLLRWTLPGRYANKLFAQSSMGKTDAGEQILSRQIYETAKEGEKQGRRLFQDTIKDIPNAEFSPDLSPKLRAYIESGKYAAELQKDAPNLKAFGDQWIKNIQPGWLADRKNAGLSSAEMTKGGIRYFPRQAGEDVFTPGTVRQMRQSASHVATPDMIGRRDYMGEFEGGTEVINKLSVDPMVRSAASDGDAAAHIINTMRAAKHKAPSRAAAVKLARTIRAMSPRAANEKVPLFGHSWAQDLERYTVGNTRSQAVADRLYDILARQAVNSKALANSNHITLRNAASSLGLKSFKNTKTNALVGAAPQLASRLGLAKTKDLAKFSIPQAKLDALQKLGRIAELPEALANVLDNFIDPLVNLFRQSVLAWTARFTRDFISGAFTNAVEVGVVPSFLGGYKAQQQLMHGDFAGLFKTLANTPRYYKYAQTNDLKGFTVQLQRDLVDSGIIAGKKSMDMAHRLERAGGASDILSNYRPGSEPVATVGTNLMAGRSPLKDTAFSKYIGKFASSNDKVGDLLSVGLPGQDIRDIRNPIFKWSADLGDTTDQINRGGGYFGLLMQGVSPEEAGRRMLDAHVDYSSLTEIERNIFKRIFPFWSYSSRIGKYIANKIWDAPGGRYKQIVLRPFNSDDDGRYTPSLIRRKYGMPLDGDDAISKLIRAGLAPNSPKGVTPWLSDIDLPGVSLLNNIEVRTTPGHQTGNLVSGIDYMKTLKSSLAGYGSEITPVIKDPLEWLTGTDFSSGRPWKDQYTHLQRVLKNTTGLDKTSFPGQVLNWTEPLVKYIPMGSRLAGTAAKLTDTERIPNLGARVAQTAFDTLTGVKIRNIQDDIAAKEALDLIEKMLEDDPYVREHTSQYIPEEILENASPSTIRLMEMARRIRAQRNSGR